jgi:recombination protein RecT
MARPPAGPPPVQPSAVAVRNDQKPELQKYAEVVRAFDREDRAADLLALLGSKEAVQRFLAVAFHAIATNSDLLKKATMPSIIQAIKDSATLGLEPTGLTAEGYIIVYGDEAHFQPGWRGYLKRIRNSGAVSDIDCQLVYMNDEFSLTLGTDPAITHVPKMVGELDSEGKPIAQRGDYRGAYAWARMPSGTKVIEWMTTADIQDIANRYSPSVKANKKSPWDTDWGEMARKTVLRRLSKRLPQSAVDLLLQIDAKADAAADETNGKVLDVGTARSAVLKALGKGADKSADDLASAKPEEAADASADATAEAGVKAGELLERESIENAREVGDLAPGEPPLDDGFGEPFE